MTKSFRKIVHCPHCGYGHTAENAFDRWMRRNPRMDSSEGHVRSDIDYWVHRYYVPGSGRAIQLTMFVELKQNGADIETSQCKSLSILRQLHQNQGRGYAERYVRDGPNGGRILVRHYGGFLLRLSGNDPNDSDWIEWNRKRIDEPTLVSILRFDLDPRSLRKIDFRANHHQPDRTGFLNLCLQP